MTVWLGYFVLVVVCIFSLLPAPYPLVFHDSLPSNSNSLF